MLVALVPPAFDRLRDGSQYRDTVRTMVADLKRARQQAISQGQPVTFLLDLSRREFGMRGHPSSHIPDTLDLQTTVGRDDSVDSTRQATIIFTPEGGSTGGTIDLVRKTGGGSRIRVDWLLGQIALEPLVP